MSGSGLETRDSSREGYTFSTPEDLNLKKCGMHSLVYVLHINLPKLSELC